MWMFSLYTHFPSLLCPSVPPKAGRKVIIRPCMISGSYSLHTGTVMNSQFSLKFPTPVGSLRRLLWLCHCYSVYPVTLIYIKTCSSPYRSRDFIQLPRQGGRKG